MCNNSEKFIARSLQQGLYIPHKDPEWEADQQFYNYRWDQQFYNYRWDKLSLPWIRKMLLKGVATDPFFPLISDPPQLWPCSIFTLVNKNIIFLTN